jgi:hypothetical protein
MLTYGLTLGRRQRGSCGRLKRINFDRCVGHVGSICGLCMSEDGLFLASSDANGTVVLRDAASGLAGYCTCLMLLLLIVLLLCSNGIAVVVQ